MEPEWSPRGALVERDKGGKGEAKRAKAERDVRREEWKRVRLRREMRLSR